ncbi:AraC family transcriptional regulator [Nocardia sp. NPDC050630]|uniref:AraC family transcriptional regulator n=1 Tax=Nocardia sp. NPDC050630 TaxID=3364321 RepID=UPI0037B61086
MTEQIESPFDPATIPPAVLTGVIEVARREGRSVSSWFAGTGLDSAVLNDGAGILVSYQQATTILRRAVRDMAGRPIGMQVGRRDTFLSFGLVGVAMRACASGAEALQVALELQRASGALVEIEAVTDQDQVTLSVHQRTPDPELTVFLIEEALCSAVVFMRSLVGAEQNLTSVELSYPAPAYAPEYRQFFRCPVRFESDAHRLSFPTALLRRRLPTHDALIRTAAIDACRRLLLPVSNRSGVSVSVESLLRRNIRNPPSMAEVADQLHITERTLRRQLTVAGESFSAVRDRVREQHATHLLNESTMTIDMVAREVGFGDAREFRRAYLRWTGRPPSAVRREAAPLHVGIGRLPAA